MSASGGFGLSDVVGGFGVDRGRFIAWARHPTNAPPTSVLEKLKKNLCSESLVVVCHCSCYFLETSFPSSTVMSSPVLVSQTSPFPRVYF